MDTEQEKRNDERCKDWILCKHRDRLSESEEPDICLSCSRFNRSAMRWIGSMRKKIDLYEKRMAIGSQEMRGKVVSIHRNDRTSNTVTLDNGATFVTRMDGIVVGTTICMQVATQVRLDTFQQKLLDKEIEKLGVLSKSIDAVADKYEKDGFPLIAREIRDLGKKFEREIKSEWIST